MVAGAMGIDRRAYFAMQSKPEILTSRRCRRESITASAWAQIRALGVSAHLNGKEFSSNISEQNVANSLAASSATASAAVTFEFENRKSMEGQTE
jgi:hypothetical protein